MFDDCKEKWVEEHARRMQKRFEQWQKPLGISGDEYCDFLREQLTETAEDPLIRSLIETVY